MQESQVWARRAFLSATLTLLSVLSVSLWGCGSRVPPPQNFSDDPARIHSAFTERREAVQTLSGELALEVWEGDERVKARQLFAAAPPHQLRIDTLSPFEQPISTLITTQERVAMHDVQQGRFRVGEASAEHVGRLSRLKLDPSALSLALSGQPPLIKTEGGEVRWDEERGLYRLTLKDLGNALADTQVLFVRPGDFTPVEVLLYRGERLEVRLLLADYTDDEPKLPKRMRFELPQESIRIEIKLKDYVLNPDLPSEAFEIKAPPGLTPEPI